MRAFPRGALGAALALAGCTAAPPDTDRTDVARDVRERTGAELTETGEAGDDDAATANAVRELLQAPLTDEAAVRVAMLQNRRVRAFCERLAIARADLVQAGLLRNPVFDADARFLFDGGTELELGLAQPFVDLFWRPLRERLAEHEFAVARLLVTDALVRLVFDVRRALVDVGIAGRTVALQRDALTVAESSHQLAVELYAAGNTTEQAVAIERAGETRARLDLAAAELAEMEVRETLQALLGLWGADTQWTVDGAAATAAAAALDVEHAERRAITASLDLAAQRAGIDAAAQVAGLASWRGFLPSGSLGLSAIREPGGEWGLGPQATFEIPLFDSGAAQRARAGANVRSHLHEYGQLAVEVRSAARQLRERVLRLAERERFLREVHLPQRAEVVRTTMQHYNAMQIGIFDVLRTRRQQLADQLEHVDVLRALLRARLDLQQLFAGGMPAPTGHADGTRRRQADAEPERGH